MQFSMVSRSAYVVLIWKIKIRRMKQGVKGLLIAHMKGLDLDALVKDMLSVIF